MKTASGLLQGWAFYVWKKYSFLKKNMVEKVMSGLISYNANWVKNSLEWLGRLLCYSVESIGRKKRDLVRPYSFPQP